jgi:hypothetical protein
MTYKPQLDHDNDGVNGGSLPMAKRQAQRQAAHNALVARKAEAERKLRARQGVAGYERNVEFIRAQLATINLMIAMTGTSDG